MSIRVIQPGLLTSVQDMGRYGFQKYGVIASGAMDPFAHRTANLLVGNEEAEATLEMTLKGAVIEFPEAALISICGGDLSPSVEGIPVPLWKPVYLKKGSILHFGYCRSGARAYLAIAGGWSVPAVMDSRSTYLRAGIGGYQGRGLRAGDELACGEPTWLGRRIADQLRSQANGAAFTTADWGAAREMLPAYSSAPVVRVMRGNQWDWFTEEGRRSFLSESYRVTPQSDRMGYRLDGPVLEQTERRELISEAVAFGTVQVPPEGKPIVLLADRQTTGGYPKIAQVATVDLPLMAQTKPGEALLFAEISREEAERLLMARENEIRQLKTGILLKCT
ncbi:biotin-dependent carboxyltransferase family protein [Brevibacillus sp. B_LB10_24]|uniref:5-oxoprolinase subunit C family protein n=1 Tax=Brevibacillus sp. B_LB10_24 TaxID=3380645 RepID=UPI0038BABE8F